MGSLLAQMAVVIKILGFVVNFVIVVGEKHTIHLDLNSDEGEAWYSTFSLSIVFGALAVVCVTSGCFAYFCFFRRFRRQSDVTSSVDNESGKDTVEDSETEWIKVETSAVRSPGQNQMESRDERLLEFPSGLLDQLRLHRLDQRAKIYESDVFPSFKHYQD